MTPAEHPHTLRFIDERADYSVALRRLLRFAPQDWNGLQALTLPQADEIRKAMLKRYKCASVKQSICAGREFFRTLALQGVVSFNPFREIRVKCPSNIPLWNVLRKGEAPKLLAAPKGPMALRDKAVLTTLLDHGFRASTLCSLRWGQISRDDNGYVLLLKPGQVKRNKQAGVYLKATTLSAARSWYDASHIGSLRREPHANPDPTAPFIARSAAGEPLDRVTVYLIVTKWAKSIGSRVTPHGLRATFISDLIERKGIEAARREAMQDSTETTARYDRWIILGKEALETKK